MFYSDNPITEKKEDRLNRTEFSKQLAKAILSYTRTDNFTISLCGKWGSGKTSILNMVIEEIKELTNDSKLNEKPIVITFNPWNYSDCTQLLNQFFQAIQSKIKVNDKNGALKTVGNAFQKYSTVLEYSTYIPVIGQYLGPIKELASNFGEHLTEKADDQDNLITHKEKVIKALKAQKQKFIVIIDDIDRLNNEQIRLIFQLVNSLAGFPNMIYVLSFDRNVVARALENEQNFNGDEYLEKIIQVPFQVPMANKSLINDAFCKMVNDIIFDNNMPTDNFERDYWETVFPFCISPFLNSMRDVNRIINTFEFKYRLMYNEVNCIDLLVLTTLQACAPEISDWIFNNSTNLTGSSLTDSILYLDGISGVDQKKHREKYLQEFRIIYNKNPEMMLQILQTLFPKFCHITGGYYYNPDSNSELRRKQKLASSDRINRYFNLSLEDILINKKQILDVIKYYDAEQLQQYFKLLMNSGRLYEFLNELIAYIPDIPKNRYLLFINELVDLLTFDENYQSRGLLALVPSDLCSACINAILKNNSESENTELLTTIIGQASLKTVPFFCKIIESIECSYGRMGDSPSNQNRLISEDDLIMIEVLVLEKIKVLFSNNCFFDLIGAGFVYRIWHHIDESSLDLYIMKILSDSNNIPKYLYFNAKTWDSGDTCGWNFKNESFDKYINIDDLHKEILKLKNSAEFSSLPHHLKEITIAFNIWYMQDSKNYHEITKKVVNSMIPEWENQKQ